MSVDGVLCDGAHQAVKPIGPPDGHGYSYFNPLGDVSGGDKLRLQPTYSGSLLETQIYERALLTSELVGNYRAAVRPGKPA